MRLTIIIVTHNRCQALASTLTKVTHLPDFDSTEDEIIVVDNGSTDGTEAMLQKDWPRVVRLGLSSNQGVSARNHGFAVARGRYVMLIDDDSYPLGRSLSASVHYLDEHEDVAAVVGRVTLPDGRCEASALPTVIINCAVVLRKSVIDKLGGFPREFFRQAEEYDLSWRIWQAGYHIQRFEDLEYRHDKVAGNRWPGWIHRMDIRNNMILVERYLPQPWRSIFRDDWTQRYFALARHAGHSGAVKLGWWQGLAWRTRMMLTGRRTLSTQAVESIFGFAQQRELICAWARQHKIKRVLIADVAKSLYVTFHACQQCGLEVAAISDNHPAYQGMNYRGVPVVSDQQARQENFDGLVLSNVNPAQLPPRLATLQSWCDKPLLSLWQPVYLHPQSLPSQQTQAA